MLVLAGFSFVSYSRLPLVTAWYVEAGVHLAAKGKATKKWPTFVLSSVYCVCIDLIICVSKLRAYFILSHEQKVQILFLEAWFKCDKRVHEQNVGKNGDLGKKEFKPPKYVLNYESFFPILR